jgi:deoxyribodipyrimidine photolyase-related protein
MGTFALGSLFVTKPYVSGSAYINRMSNFCGHCQFEPAGSCPIKSLYWAFLDRFQQQLETNPRMKLILRTLGKREQATREKDRQVFQRVSELLESRSLITPETLE